MKSLKEIKSYLKVNIIYLGIALVFFLLGGVLGFIFQAPLFGQILKEIQRLASFAKNISPFLVFLLIFFNNSLAVFFIIFLGIGFGIIPILALVFNGGLLGLVASLEFYPWLLFLAGTLPHGIIEIPALLLAGGLGIKIGKEVLTKIFSKKTTLKNDFSFAKSIFLKIILPLLFLSALIEAFATPLIIKKLF